ncbi:hypothetical protein AArcSl_0502 [Halalkaliarchaeum desulfuricum]|uniref:DUF7344 domain-containing protein n=1 Tax=Halalkaliarchaeum desulfuricum TaxID=2055893 RepID=A0A343TGD1_9EURY|nr:hypothetical protein [Halalkaliarchaeum desulfuricum]AUX08153.1 hypothetical protein AArcSl_0502 [Halalkaliarchaeum desulfuricum]
MTHNEGGFTDLPDSVSDASESILFRSGMARKLDILSESHRRMILLLLKEGTIETQADVKVRSGDQKKEVERALIHTHLPKLDDAGYIEWDRETGEISKGPRFDEIEPLLELIESHSDELPPDWP